jgi:hypothetical protein
LSTIERHNKRGPQDGHCNVGQYANWDGREPRPLEKLFEADDGSRAGHYAEHLPDSGPMSDQHLQHDAPHLHYPQFQSAATPSPPQFRTKSDRPEQAAPYPDGYCSQMATFVLVATVMTIIVLILGTVL